MMLETIPVPRAEITNPQEFISSIESRMPLQVHGLINDWDALGWRFDALTEKYGERKVKVLLDMAKFSGILEGGQENYEKIMSFADFVKKILSNPDSPCYMAYSKATDFLTEEMDAYNFSNITPHLSYPVDTRLWIGSANTCSGLHTDLKDNIFAQVIGQKKVFLVPANQTHLVYPFIDNIVNSQVNPEQYEPDKFPKFASATVYSTVVKPGDILSIPRGWWHYLRSESPSISINHWFGKPVSAYTYLSLLIKLGSPYLKRTFADMYRYGILKKEYKKEFFFTPASTGERLFNLIRYGDFSKENDPANKDPIIK